ncbi:MAG TPA: hypothetical protein VLG37_03625 [Candidatus Saccharimonadales bacterium]|nr:hypothetical protein [Candidatus Saccharimonadales bacterium]
MKKRRSSKRPAHKLLVHKAQTGKLVPAGHTSYPLLAFVLLFLGIVLMNLTLQVRAADVVVNGRVPGNPPSQPAIITSPADGTHFTGIPITVQGTCPAGNIVKLYRNDTFSGAVMCDSTGHFSLQTDLFPGANVLRARIFNLGDTEGPQSAPITVYYDIPGPSGPTPPENGGTTPKTLLLETNIFFRGYYVGDTVHWKLSIEGGTPPYAIAVDWGDGNSSVISRSHAGLFEIGHVYKKPGGWRGSYPIKLKASDSVGQQASLQLVVIVNNPKAVNSIVPSGLPPAFLSILHMLRPVWSFYAVALLMTTSFWLGEKRGFAIFNRRLKSNNRRPRPA